MSERRRAVIWSCQCGKESVHSWAIPEILVERSISTGRVGPTLGTIYGAVRGHLRSKGEHNVGLVVL